MFCKWCGVGMMVRRWLPRMCFYEECLSCKRRTPTLRYVYGTGTNLLPPPSERLGEATSEAREPEPRLEAQEEETR